MGGVYNLDLETMLATLLRRQQSGILSARLPSGKVGKGPGHIEIVLNRGKVVTCQLTAGQLDLRGRDALQVIAGLGVLPWAFVASPPQSSLARTQPLPAVQLTFEERVPRRLVTLQGSQLAKLPRPHFQVYAHVDGKRTLGEIANLLRLTPEQIENILGDLQAWQLVSRTS
jgi:hypothetical protein